MISHFLGAAALSDFRIKKYLSKLKAISPRIRNLSAFYEYFIDSTESLSSTDETRLNHLLNFQAFSAQKFAFPSIVYLVVPRIGTVSPWSTKATDIVHLCGFSSIRRLERGISFHLEFEGQLLDDDALSDVRMLLHDPMLETVLSSFEAAKQLFVAGEPAPLNSITMLEVGEVALKQANESLGLALSDDEITYFFHTYKELARNPTDVELMMFAQANSEHCRHKIFNAEWVIDGVIQPQSLFSMIKNTYQKSPQGVLSAYQDNAAIFEGPVGKRFSFTKQRIYQAQEEPIHALIKVETHNHPTAIAPFPGAATGSGGEIRDEGATGRGAKPKAGLTGFSVSHLRIPDFSQPWEDPLRKPQHIASSLEIMLSGPIGAAAFNNEFGRPNIVGYFRTFEYLDPKKPQVLMGYHKPIMLAGGIGNIRSMHTHKNQIMPNDLLIVLGGPALLIGLGGGSASSMQGDTTRIEQDFASVQRPNPEMQRRCQEVIDQCWTLGDCNPIVALHDVGAGGLSNAIPELVHESKRGAHIQLRDIPSDDPHLSPMEIWCNEAQERYVLAIKPQDLPVFEQITKRERCPFAVVGVATDEQILVVEDRYFKNNAIDMPMAALFGKPPKLKIEVQTSKAPCVADVNVQTWLSGLLKQGIENALNEIIERILHFPSVSSKSFLITIGDRTVGGLVARDPMVGPWQIPVADVGVTATDFEGYTGEAMTVGERTPLAVINAEAAARMAIGEVVTNIAAAYIQKISDIKLSANWMAAAKSEGQSLALFKAVKTVGLDICPILGISIPVGKDSLSMQMDWREEDKSYRVVSPVSPIISGFSQVQDIRKTLTPQLIDDESTEILLIDLGSGKNRLGGSALMQVYGYLGEECPDLDDPLMLKHFFDAIQSLNSANLLLAYHDRSDGGLFTTLSEMAFAAHKGITIQLMENVDPISFLFNEELGAVIQISSQHKAQVNQIFANHQLEEKVISIARLNSDDHITLVQGEKIVFKKPRTALQKMWSETSFHMQRLRDNPDCAIEEFAIHSEENDPGLSVSLSFNNQDRLVLPFVSHKKPLLAILREQGVNGHIEMAAAFTRVGFECVDVHMSDLISGEATLKAFLGVVAVGGFSYGDVLGAGRGWANAILHNPKLYDEFSAFFARTDTFALGICNGCQMMANLKSIIPGASHWPIFVRNRSEQFEARFSMVKIPRSKAILFSGMENSQLPIAIAHGEGRVKWLNSTDSESLQAAEAVALHYIDHHGKITEMYPHNPNGSPEGVAGVTNADGRFTILMPHPERVFRTVQWSWHPKAWGEYSPWMRMFENLRMFVK